MAAVFAPQEKVLPHLAVHAATASIAAVNEPDQCVVSGEAGAVDAVLVALAAAGITSRPLAIGCAAHSPLMAGAGEEIAAALAREPLRPERSDPSPLYSTVTGARIEGPLSTEHWRRQMTAPVLFADAVRAAADAGIDVFLEVAATAALSPCMERTLEGRGAEVLPLLRRSAGGRAAPLAALGRLFERGVPLALERLEGVRPDAHPPLPPYAYGRRRLWIDGPSVLSYESEPSARDHLARGRAIAPAARLIELALLATEGERGPGGGLGEVLVIEPLPLAPGAPRDVAARALGPLSARRASVASRPAGGGAWTAHLRGAVLEGGAGEPGAAPPAPLDVAAIRARCREEIDPAALYEHTARNGLAHGPHMRRVASLARGPGEVLARLEAAPGAPPRAFDPALVDGAMQAIGGLTVGGDDSAPPATYLGFAYREVRTWAPLAGPCLAHVRHLGGLSPEAESFRVDVAIADLEGRVLVAMREVALKRSHAPWEGGAAAPAPVAVVDEAPLRAYAVEWAPIAPGPSTSGALRAPCAQGDRWGGDNVVLGGPERPFPRDDTALADLLRASLAGPGPAPRLILLEPRLDDVARLPRALDAAPRAPSEVLVLASDPAVMGLLRVLSQEEPGLALWGVEVEAEAGPLALAEALLQESTAARDALHIARRRGSRLAPVLRALGPPPGRSLLRPGAALWITGGAGAVGLALAETLARTLHARLLLTGRRPSLEPEARARLDASGARWLYVKADAASPREMARAYEEGRARLGPLEGAIHAAGVIDDRPLRATAPGDLERALRPKREGARALIDMATRGGLAFVALMGSLTARAGGPGQGAYAAANAALSGIAERASHGGPRGPRVIALDWGPFRIGMAGAPEHQAGYRALGLRPHSIERAARALVDALAHDAAEVMLLDHDEGLEQRLGEAMRGAKSGNFIAAHPERSAAAGGAQSKGGLVARPSPGPAREQVHAAPSTPVALRAPSAQGERVEAAGERGVVEFVTDFLSRRLRKPASAIDPRAAFSRMGVDSLMAVELVKSLERRSGRRLYPTLLFEVPTIEALAAFLEREGSVS